ncbi:MAG: hypothetical protein JW818_14130, partial [Pirellulales bacterium]|nr:hypothetical protein [Pirellulales bacterium]
ERELAELLSQRHEGEVGVSNGVQAEEPIPSHEPMLPATRRLEVLEPVVPAAFCPACEGKEDLSTIDNAS